MNSRIPFILSGLALAGAGAVISRLREAVTMENSPEMGTFKSYRAPHKPSNPWTDTSVPHDMETELSFTDEYLQQFTDMAYAISMEDDALDASMLGPLPLPKGKDHLVYRDFPKMPLHVWQWTKKNLEAFELEIITDAEYMHPDGQLGRGQIFVHPDGLKHLQTIFSQHAAMLFPDEG